MRCRAWYWRRSLRCGWAWGYRSEEHTSELQSHRDLHSFPTRRSSDLQPRTAAVFDPYVKMANALPRVVLAPIFTLWLGLGIWSKVALGVTLVFFIVFFNVYQGVKEVLATVLDNGRMLGMNERQLMRHVYWPSALSWMFSSLHTSVGFAVVGAVVGEYLGSAAGLGYLIQQAEGVFDVAGVFAGMFVLAAFVMLIDWIVTMVEKRLLVWRPVAAETRT